MPGIDWGSALGGLISGIGQAGLNIGSAFALKELGMFPSPAPAGYPMMVPQGVPPNMGYSPIGVPMVNATQASLLGNLLAPDAYGMPGLIPGALQPLLPGTSGNRGVLGGAFPATNPFTGRQQLVKSVGRPLLWSGDLAACKRVRKVASRARRRLGGR